ncbi:uncharacterized protein LOC135218078 [Macrobrachium nipponense]|uniref:uncharacterized protein LOC135218078 n=1 Tax=Macrobrachium nipponense TaxID=159736 RepID=UPI0030C8C451
MPVTHSPTTTTTKTVSMPGYAAPPHLVYTQHVATVTPTAAVQAPLPEVRMSAVMLPPGFASLASAPDFRCPKSSPLDLPPVQRMLLVPAPPPVLDYDATPVLVPVPAAVVPARGVAAPTPGPSGQVQSDGRPDGVPEESDEEEKEEGVVVVCRRFPFNF